MQEILIQYHKMDPVTWVYVSSLLMIGLFFKFNRFWSVRNLDLTLLILLAPGLLLVQFGGEMQDLGKLLYRTAQESNPSAWDTEVVAEDEGEASVSEEDPEAESPLQLPEMSLALIAAERQKAQELNEPPAPWDVAELAFRLEGRIRLESRNTEACRRLVEGISLSTITAPELDPGVLQSLKTLLVRVIKRGERLELAGFIWMFSTGSLLLVRLLVDPVMVRRPLLEPNLTVGGLSFISGALFLFLMANVFAGTPTESDLEGAKGAEQLIHRQETPDDDKTLLTHGPGYRILFLLPSIPTVAALDGSKNGGSEETDPKQQKYVSIAKTMAVLAHLAVVVGMVVIGYRHFDNIRMGIGAASLYLLLPYTAQMTGRVDHVLPAALLIWSIATYRKPLLAGMFIGLAVGVVYYPLFLLPLWISFYWQRGLLRFGAGVAITVVVLVVSLAFTSNDMAAFQGQVSQMFGLRWPETEGLSGIWAIHWDAIYRIPVMTACIAMSCSMALWPAQKNLGTLLSCSSAVMLSTQFWHGYGGGTYIAWYLPVLLLTIFRPNLEDRVASTVLNAGWLSRRRANPQPVDLAA